MVRDTFSANGKLARDLVIPLIKVVVLTVISIDMSKPKAIKGKETLSSIQTGPRTSPINLME
jgi:hypothetical protein